MITKLINAVSPKTLFNLIRSKNSAFLEIKEDLSYLIENESKFAEWTKLGVIEYNAITL